MDYLSLDTEGSELDILKAFPYQDFRFNCITVEHNFQERERAQILRLLEANAYVRGENPFFLARLLRKRAQTRRLADVHLLTAGGSGAARVGRHLPSRRGAAGDQGEVWVTRWRTSNHKFYLSRSSADEVKVTFPFLSVTVRLFLFTLTTVALVPPSLLIFTLSPLFGNQSELPSESSSPSADASVLVGPDRRT